MAAAKAVDPSLDTKDATPYASLVQFLKTYYPKKCEQWAKEHPQFLTHVLPFQETWRCLVAERRAYEGGKDNGQSSIRILRVLLDGRRASLPMEFVSVAETELKSAEAAVDADSGAGVRGQVRKVMMWPETKYMDVIPLDAAKEAEILAEIKRLIPAIKGTELDAGACGDTVKVSVPGFIERLWADPSLRKLLENAIPGVTLQVNPESSHITIVNSGVIKGGGKSGTYATIMKCISQLVADADDLEVVSLKIVWSPDFAPHRFCLLVNIASKALDGAVEMINSQFGLEINPLKHITTGTHPRYAAWAKVTTANAPAAAAMAGSVMAVTRDVVASGNVVTMAVNGNVTPEMMKMMMAARSLSRR